MENSILFRGVKVKKGAVIRNSIIMLKSDVGSKATLENVIIDKEVTVRKERHLRGEVSYPMFIDRQSVV